MNRIKIRKTTFSTAVTFIYKFQFLSTSLGYEWVQMQFNLSQNFSVIILRISEF